MNTLFNAYLQMLSTITNEEGQGMAEYGLILALVAVVVIAGLTVLGGNISGLLSGITFAAGS